jgi:peptide-methionine (S)-S-oxide reductase
MIRLGYSAVLLAVLALVGISPTITPTDLPKRPTETATFAAGCFWGAEAAFRQVKGVTDTAVGYMGGTTPNPTYEQVSTRKTGHIEVCQVTYDPTQVSYEKLVMVLFQIHDPTAYNPDGRDLASQYRSVIFFHTPEQEKIARAAMEQLQASGKFHKPIAVAIVPATEFWRAEEYHQRYDEKHQIKTCRIAS